MDTTGAVDLGIPRIRTSERKDFKRCQWRWQQIWRHGLVPRFEKPGALWFGIGMHLALQHRYQYRGTRRGKDPIKVWREYAKDTQAVVYLDGYEDDKTAFIDAVELGEIMLDGYLAKYGTDDRWFVISAEQTFEIPIPYPSRVRNPAREWLALYNGTFDLVAIDQESDDSLWLWDHKNMKSIQTNHLSLDDQAGSYWAVASDVLRAQGLIEPGMKLDGILYNFLRKAKPDERPKNAEGLATNKPQKSHYLERLANEPIDLPAKPTLDGLAKIAADLGITVLGDVSKQQPLPNFHRETVWRTRAERRTQIERIQDEALQMQAIRDRTMRPTKNPTKDCSWDCPLFDMCQLHEAGDDWKSFRDAAFVKRDPYAAHREVVADE